MNLKVNFSTLTMLIGMFIFFGCSSTPNDNNSFRDKWVGLSENASTHQDAFEVIQQAKKMDVASCANCTEDFKKEFLYHLELWDKWLELKSNEETFQTKKAIKETMIKIRKSAVRINELSNSRKIY